MISRQYQVALERNMGVFLLPAVLVYERSKNGVLGPQGRHF